MKLQFKNILFLAAAVLTLIALIVSIASNATPLYPIVGFVFLVIAAVVAVAGLAASGFGLLKGSIKDVVVFVAIAAEAVCLGLLILSRGYAYGTLVFTTVESGNEYLKQSFASGVAAAILFGASLLLAAIRNFIPDSANK